MPADLLGDFAQRGLLHQVTESGLAEALAAGPVTGYIGFDPTAASLHVGSLLPVTALRRLQQAGHRPIAVVGGGTGLIGDPSGKETERTMLDRAKIAENVAGQRAQLERFLDFAGPRGALLVDNLDWLGGLALIDFLRDVGKHFSVNAMIQRDSVKTRLESREHGISFTEFSYMLLQAYDFLALHDRYGCTLQLGGSDQWGNIVSGADLIRRLRGAPAHGLTMPLLTREGGKKFGKSETGNVWLDPALTTPYEFYQFWLNSVDADAVRLLKFFTFLPLARIEEVAAEVARAPERREAQRVLAAEVTTLVHGAEALARAEQATAILFGGGDFAALTEAQLREAFARAPKTRVARAALDAGELKLAPLLADTGLCDSRGQARKALQEGAISLNNLRQTDGERALSTGDLLAGRFLLLRRGKKTWHVVEIE